MLLLCWCFKSQWNNVNLNVLFKNVFEKSTLQSFLFFFRVFYAIKNINVKLFQRSYLSEHILLFFWIAFYCANEISTY